MSSITFDKAAFPYEAILWDIDGTLADSEPVHLQSFVSVCAELDLHLPDGFHDHLMGKTDEATHRWLVENSGLNLRLMDWNLKRVEHYLQRIEDVKPHKISLDLWLSFEASGVKQATVSNSDRIIVQHNLDRLQINKPGAVSVALNDVCEGKPSPEPYLRAAHPLVCES